MKVDFEINQRGGFKDVDSGDISLLWDQQYVLTLAPRKIHPTLEAGGVRGFRMLIEAEDTACAAEDVGTRAAYAILCIAVDRLWGLSLAWPDSPLPCRVIDRTASRGLTVQGFASSTSHLLLGDFVDRFDAAFKRFQKVPYRLLLSMELCASSRLESNTRSRLLLLVSAFEALAEQRDFSKQLEGLIAKLQGVLSENELADEALRPSLKGQIDRLARESVARAIRRMLGRHSVITDADAATVEKAYGARSDIVHEGKRVPELDAMANELDFLLMRLYPHYRPD